MRKSFISTATACFAFLILSGTSFAATEAEFQSNVGSGKKTDSFLVAQIEQNGQYAERLGTVLEQIKMPAGFKIELFAIVPGARHMAVSPDKNTVIVGTRRKTVWLVAGNNSGKIAKSVKEFSPGTKFDVPNGVCFSPDGYLFIAERNRILMFEPDAIVKGSDPVPIVKQGDLIPPSEESQGHTARVCAIGPDNRLYVSLGQPYNVSPPHKNEMYKKTGIGGIIRMNRDGSKREVVATGIRNSVGHAFNPEDGSLWFTDNQVDGMGDEIPPGELNRLVIGGWYGFPYYGGGDTRTNEYSDVQIPANDASRYVAPQVNMIAHAADLGMMFYSGKMFPKTYNNAIFSAQHGSWNATKPRGARVMVTFLDGEGNAAKTIPFAWGWMTTSGTYKGRPVDVQQYGDGSILVSDDKAGAIYRISYSGN